MKKTLCILLFCLGTAHAQRAVVKVPGTNTVTESLVFPTGKTLTINSGATLNVTGATVTGLSLEGSTWTRGNVRLGDGALGVNTTGLNNIAFGYYALGEYNTSGSGNVAIGYLAGAFESGSDTFYLNNRNRDDLAGDRTLSLLYGTFANTATAQQLTVNAGALNLHGGTTAGKITLQETDAHGTSTTGFIAPTSLAATVLYTLPSADGSSGQVLSTNGSGTLSWATGGGGITIGTTAITGGTSGRLLTSGSTVGELTLGSGVSAWLGTPTLANLNSAVSDADLASSGANADITSLAAAATVNGGTVANADITLNGTSHATRTTSYVLLQPSGGNVGVRTSTPLVTLHVEGGVIFGTGKALSMYGLSAGTYPTFGFNDFDATEAGAYVAGVTGFGFLEQVGVSEGTWTIYSSPSVSAGVSRSHNARMTVTKDGGIGIGTYAAFNLSTSHVIISNNVGIGTSTPASSLEIGANKFSVAGATGNTAIAGTLGVTGDVSISKTVTAVATTGAQTINKTSGRINFAAAATSLVVTNSLCTANSIIHCTVATNDATANGLRVVAAAGSFTIYFLTAPTAETAVNFILTN